MARKKHQDRNKVARATMEEKKLMRERIEGNEELFKKNLEDIPKMEEKLRDLEFAFGLDNEGDKIKLSGLDVINPTFEFERSEAWKEWNKKSIELSIKNREKKFDDMKKQIEESIENLKKQNERIEKENSELTASLSQQNSDSDNYIG